AVGVGVGVERLGDLVEDLARRAANVPDQFRGVAVEVAKQDLKDTARVLHLRVLLRRWADQLADLGAERVRLALARGATLALPGVVWLAGVAPLLLVVAALLGIETREDSGVGRVLCILEVLGDQRRSICVARQVVVEEAFAIGPGAAVAFLQGAKHGHVLVEDVLDQRAEKDDVAACADRSVDI